MTASDGLLIAALALFLGVCALRRLPARRLLLALFAIGALASTVLAVSDDRWQAALGAAISVVLLLAVGVSALIRRPAGPIVHVLAVVATALLVVLAIAPLLLFPVSPLPKPAGPQAIGVRDFVLTDHRRTGMLGAASDEPRRLLVRVWYPAQPSPDAEPRRYFDEREAKTTARGFGELVGFPPLLTHLKHVSTNAYPEAPLLPTDGLHPVLFFSHGYAGYPGGHSLLLEHLASHGYVIYAIHHSGDASPAVLPDGEVLPVDPGLIEHLQHLHTHGFVEAMVRGFTAEDLDARIDGQLDLADQIKLPADRGFMVSAPVWLADRLFVHDALQAGSVPANVADLVAASDLARTGEIGVSFGGSTSGAVCMVDPRCVAAVNLDGGDFHVTPFNAELPVPLLMFHSDFAGIYRMFGVEPSGTLRSFNDFSYERFDQAGQRRDLYRLQLKDSMHLGLTDSGIFVRWPLRDPLFGSTPIEVLTGAPNDFVLGFLDRHLRGIDNGFPQPQYQRYAGWVTPYDNTPVRQWWQAKSPEARATIERRIAVVKARLPQPIAGEPNE